MADSGSEHDAIVTPEDSSAGTFLLKRLIMNERLGRPFQAELYLLSDSEDIDFTKLVGRKLAVQVTDDGEVHRKYHGYVSRFVQADRDNESSSSADASEGNRVGYRATLVPWLSLLTHTKNCKIWQDMTVPDIIKEVFSDLGFTDFSDELTGTYKQWKYCVQYQETAFAFVQRLMEHEGIYYYFMHEDTSHNMIIADGISSHQGFIDAPMVYRKKGDTATEEHIKDWVLRRHVRPGKFVTTDYDYENSTEDLKKEKVSPLPHGEDSLEIFDYPGHYLSETGTNGQAYAEQRLEALHAGYETCGGRTDNHFIHIGATFELVEHDRSDQNREYLIIANKTIITPDTFGTAASGGAGMSKGNVAFINSEFVAIDKTRQFRLLRETPWPKIGGPQTATVAGGDEEKVYTDEYGRIKVLFHWDRIGSIGDQTSCWIRVAQRWAGKEWGTIHLPRVGQEVIVDFLDGDPNRPLVTGSVYNDEHMPPYGLPDNKTQAGVKSRSHGEADAEKFNEMRFEDKPDDEHIYLHAEKNMEHIVENDYVVKVGYDKNDPGDHTIEVYNTRSATMESGDDNVTVSAGNQTVDVAKEILIKAGDQITLETGQSKIVMKSDGTIEVTGKDLKMDLTATIKGTANQEISFKSKADFKAEGLKSLLKAETKVEVKGAMAEITGSAMAKIKGGAVMIN